MQEDKLRERLRDLLECGGRGSEGAAYSIGSLVVTGASEPGEED